MTEDSIVLFKDGDVSLDVPISPERDTVWLNRNQMALLFDRDVKTIGKHINNALEAQKKDLEEKEKDLEKREKAFNSSVNTKLRGWEMPELKLLEGAGAYRDRVELEVKGKISRALKTIDEYDGKVKWIQRDADERVAEQKRFVEMYKTEKYMAVNDGKKEKEKYNILKNSILEARTVEEINKIKNDLMNPSREREGRSM